MAEKKLETGKVRYSSACSMDTKQGKRSTKAYRHIHFAVMALDVYYSTQTAQQLADPKYGLQLMSDGYIVENILAELRGETATPLSNSNSELKLYKNELR